MKPLHHKTHTLAKRGLSLLCVLALCLSLLPVTALAAAEGAPSSLYVGNYQITNSDTPTYLKASSTEGSLTEGSETDWNVKYDPSTATLTLKNATIKGVSDDVNIVGAGIYAASSSGPVSLNIVLEGENEVTGGYGINVSNEGAASLSISGSGSLTVSATATNGIGIFVQAQSGDANLTIDGANVNAVVTENNGRGVELSTGQAGNPNLTIEVKGGSLQASGQPNGIKFFTNKNNTQANANLKVSGNAMVKTSGITTEADGSGSQGAVLTTEAGSGETGGIVFDNGTGTVYGAVTLQEDITIGEGESLTIPDGASLNTNGKLTVDGGTLNGTPSGDVTYKVTKVELSTSTLALTEGGSETLTATITPDNATNKAVTWSSSDSSIVTVGADQTDNTKATVKALKEGSATITATTADGNKTATCTVTVTAKTYSLSVDKSTLNFGSITEGDTLPAAQTVTVKNNGNQTVTLNPPTATNFEIGTLSAKELKPDESATFTIQPRADLNVGSYSEQITISGNDGASATLTATFTVKEPPYSGKYSYEISTDIGDNGTLNVDRYATEGDTVTIEITPDQAYLLDELVVTAGGKDVELTDNHDGTFTFTMPSADVKISATFAEDPDWTEPEEPATDISDLFSDIAPDAWYKDAVQYAYDHGLMTGVSDTEFAPEATTTRAMIVSILARLEGVESAEAAGFADVDDNDWYATAVNWAANVGVVNGYEDNTFRPNQPITREQLAAILMNYAVYKGYDVSARADLTSYTDQPSTWAQETMQWAVAEGLISGVTNDQLQPQSSATRAQVAAILQRLLEA